MSSEERKQPELTPEAKRRDEVFERDMEPLLRRLYDKAEELGFALMCTVVIHADDEAIMCHRHAEPGVQRDRLHEILAGAEPTRAEAEAMEHVARLAAVAKGDLVAVPKEQAAMLDVLETAAKAGATIVAGTPENLPEGLRRQCKDTVGTEVMTPRKKEDLN